MKSLEKPEEPEMANEKEIKKLTKDLKSTWTAW